MVHSVLQTLRIETAVLFELLLQLILGRCPDDYDGSVGEENNGESAHAQINGGRRFGSKARSSVALRILEQSNEPNFLMMQKEFVGERFGSF